MKTNYELSNLLGSVYTDGNIVFAPDGQTMYSCIGNRVKKFQLKENTSSILPVQHRKNIQCLAISPNGTLLLSIDVDGKSILTNTFRNNVLHHFSFSQKIFYASFSPNGKYIAVGTAQSIEIWKTFDLGNQTEFAPFVRHHVHTGHFDSINTLEWSNDSRFLLSASEDMTARIVSVNHEEGFEKTVLAGHKSGVVAAYFNENQDEIYTISKDGSLFIWNFKPLYKEGEEMLDDNDDRLKSHKHIWMISKRHYFQQGASNSILHCSFHAHTGLLASGLSNGVFLLHFLPDFSPYYTLSISSNSLTCATINPTGDWIAFGSKELKQLLVWEWKSESYVLKQQGHYDTVNAIAYSPDGKKLSTGSEDGKLKVWDLSSGFVIVTFDQHTEAITDLTHASMGTVLYSSSLDGTVRAWDLSRYRNFRTFTAPSRVQFSCVATDISGEVVCAGSHDTFDIYLWSLRTGQLLNKLSGHDGPISSMAFSPTAGILASGGWDHTVRIWDVFGRGRSVEPLITQSDILALAFHPDGKSLCVALLDGTLSFWNWQLGAQTLSIDGRKDISGGRLYNQMFSAANSAATKHFSSVSYSADGSCIIAAGRSKYICIYDIKSLALLKKFTISQNLSLDGTQEMLNSKLHTEAGPLNLLEEDVMEPMDTLPGAQRGDKSKRKTLPEVRVTNIKFSPVGKSFSASCTEGVLLYSEDDELIFDPIDLDMDVTIGNLEKALQQQEYSTALIMSLRLNEKEYIKKVLETVPIADVELIVESTPRVYLENLLQMIATCIEASVFLERSLLWLRVVLIRHGKWLKDNSEKYGPCFRYLEKAVSTFNKDLMTSATKNKYTLEYMIQRTRACAKTTSD